MGNTFGKIHFSMFWSLLNFEKPGREELIDPVSQLPVGIRWVILTDIPIKIAVNE